MARRPIKRRVNSPRAQKAALQTAVKDITTKVQPKIPSIFQNYLRDDCCIDGLVALDVFLRNTDPALAVKLVLRGIPADKLKKAREQAIRQAKNALQSLEEYRQEYQDLTGDTIQVSIVPKAPAKKGK